jgi:selenocysteine-specific translation elongation factor
MEGRNRKERRAARAEGHIDTVAFLKVADKFIDVANRQNERVRATELHLAFLYASARYSAYVAKVVLDAPNHEDFVTEMTGRYQEMLRQHLADPSLVTSKGT